jgi:hypothetical protein
VVVAVMLTVFIGLAALVVDNGLTADRLRQGQSAADASALAAAVTLTQNGTVPAADAAARRYAAANAGVSGAEWNSCTAPLQPGYVPMTTTPCISYDPAARIVRIALPQRQLPSVFGGIYGVSSRTLASSAAATYGNVDPANCVLCVLDTLAGQVGGIQVDGGNVLAARLTFNNQNGRIDITNGGFTGFSVSWDGSGAGTPWPPVKVPAVADPYQNVPMPALNTSTPAVEGSGTCAPGYYTDVNKCTSFTGGGIYVLVNGDSAPDADVPNSMFFLTCNSSTGSGNKRVYTARYCNPGESGAVLAGTGSKKTRVTISGLASGPYRNFAVFVDRENTALQKWAGNGELNVTGIMYSANPDSNGGLTTRGNGQLTVRGRAVIGYLDMRGRGNDKAHVNIYGPAPDASLSAPTIPRLVR